MVNVGKKIRQYRVIRDITPKEITAALKISKSAYSNIETGKTDITISRLSQIACILNVNYQDLLPSDPREFLTPANEK